MLAPAAAGAALRSRPARRAARTSLAPCPENKGKLLRQSAALLMLSSARLTSPLPLPTARLSRRRILQHLLRDSGESGTP